MPINGRIISSSDASQLIKYPTNDKATGSIKLDNASLAITQQQQEKNKFVRLLSQVNYFKRSFKNSVKLNLIQHKVRPIELAKPQKIPDEVIYKIAQELKFALQLYIDQNQQHGLQLQDYILGFNSSEPQLGRYFELNKNAQIICKSLPNDPHILAKLLDDLLNGHSRTQQSTLYRVIHSAISNDQGQLKNYLQINWVGKIKAKKPSNIPSTITNPPQSASVVNLHNSQTELIGEQLEQHLTVLLGKMKDKSDLILNTATQHDYYATINNRLSHLFGFHQSGRLPITGMMQSRCDYAKICQTLVLNQRVSRNILNHWLQLDVEVGKEKTTVENRLFTIQSRLSLFQEEIVKQYKVPSINLDALTACQQAKLALAKIKPSRWITLMNRFSHNSHTVNLRVNHAKWRIDNLLKAILQEPACFEQIKNKPYIRTLIAGELKYCLDSLKSHPTFLGKEVKFIKTNEYKAFEELMISLGYTSPNNIQA